MAQDTFNFIVNKSQLAETKLEQATLADLNEGEVLFSIDRFALTSNNITYGVAGDMLNYWQFFPCKEGWGRIPVWGIAKVVQSRCSEVKVDSLYYGYYPMSKHLIVSPVKVGEHGFSDGAEQRQGLSPVYNQYTLMTKETGFLPEHYNHQIVYRPLFMTSFILDDYMLDNDFFGAEQIILSSASSKTAFGTAFQLQGRDKKIIGLTSGTNKAFVEKLGLYDQVLTYQEVGEIDKTISTAYIDMSGNRRVLAEVHHHLKENLVCSCGVGITHWDALDGEDPRSLPGAAPSMFFAPDQIQKRTKEWGGEVLQARIGVAWDKFVKFVDQHVQFKESLAPKAIDATYQILIKGPAPDKAYVVRFPEN
ncbi:MAG: DUF2855 family protein [Pseudomonadales bacterium]|nr:DUF2855 family protein [Pseudomonadales bacterium]